MAAWWTCNLPLSDGQKCGDRMAFNADPRIVERDRNAHLAARHAGQRIEPRALMVSWWAQTGEPARVQV